MSLALRRAFRYARGWLRDPADLVVSERILSTPDGPLPATLLLPASPRAPVPGWVVLHGITRPGRAHPTLVRFARALASSGAAVLIPEVPEWVALELAPRRALPAVRAGLDALAAEPAVRPGPAGVMGFSFGAPQAVVASGHPELADRIAGAVGFGAYCDLERTVRFQLSGVHEWRGHSRWIRPDPYGRWIVAGNYLHRIPGWESARGVADALLELAAVAGESRIPSWDPCYDGLKRERRMALPTDQREIFDVFAPPSTLDPLPESPALLDWVDRLTRTALAADPFLDPVPGIRSLPHPVHLLHGREDQLIPYTESLRLAERLSAHRPLKATVTGLFGHSSEHAFREATGRVREAVGFVRALARVLSIV